MARAGLGRQVDQCVQHFLYAEVIDGRSEKYGGLLAGQEGGVVEFRRGSVDQLDFFVGFHESIAKALRDGRVVQAIDQLVLVAALFLAGPATPHPVSAYVEDTAARPVPASTEESRVGKG